MQPLKLPILITVLALLAACKGATPKGGTVQSNGTSNNAFISMKDSENTETSLHESNSKTLNGITYSFRLMSALEFLERKGELVAESDKTELIKEVVLIATFKNSEAHKSIFEASQITMDQEAATQYLVGTLADDLTLEQGGKSITPSGVQYEKSIAEMGQLRAFFYFNEINEAKKTKIIYYDRLFGAGLIRFTIN